MLNEAVCNFLFDKEDDEKLQKYMPIFEAARNLKDPEKIALNIIEKKDKWMEGVYTNPFTNKITGFCISVIDNGSVVSNVSYYHDEEKKVLKMLQDITNKEGVDALVWHNSKTMYAPKIRLTSTKYALNLTSLRMANLFDSLNPEESTSLSEQFKYVPLKDILNYYDVKLSDKTDLFFSNSTEELSAFNKLVKEDRQLYFEDLNRTVTDLYMEYLY